jgi:hypothetical protein
MAAKTYRKTALVTAEQFLPEIGQIPKGVFSNGNGDPRKRYDCEWVIDTKEGRHFVRAGDYICTGPAGEQWNVAAEIFEATYEEVISALSTQVQDVAGWQSKEIATWEDQQAFEAWAQGERYEMHQHPLHYLFIDPETNAARQGWKAALQFIRDRYAATPAKQEG